jgi:hypothetical protein
MLLHILTTVGLVVCVLCALGSAVMAVVTRGPEWVASGVIAGLCSISQYQQWSVLP